MMIMASAKAKRFITAALQNISSSSETPPHPSLPPELVTYTLTFLPWEEIIFQYGVLPTPLVDAALAHNLYEASWDKKKPLFYLSSSYPLLCNPTWQSCAGVWLRYSQFDPDARILWLSPNASEGRHFFKIAIETPWTVPVDYGFKLKLATNSDAAPRKSRVLGRYADVVPLVRTVDDFGSGLKTEELAGKRVRLCGVDYLIEGYLTPGIPVPASSDDIKSLEEAMRIDDQTLLDPQQQQCSSDNTPDSALITEAHEICTSASPAPNHTVPLGLFPASPCGRTSFLCRHTGILYVDRVGLALSSFFQFSHELPCASNGWQPPKSARLPPDPTGVSTMYPRRLRWIRDRLAGEYHPREFPVRLLVKAFLRDREVRLLETEPFVGSAEMTEEKMYMMLFREEVMETKEKELLEKKVLVRARELMRKLTQ